MGNRIPWLTTLMMLILPLMAWGQSDQVFTGKPTPTGGTITETSPNEITMNVQGSDRKIPVIEVKKIMFGDDGPELRRARDSAIAGEFNFALEELKKINPENLKRDLTKADWDYYKAYCEGKLAMGGMGDKAAAVRSLLGFMNTHRTSFHAYEAAELLGDLAVSLESFDNAIKYYGFLGRAPWPDYQMKSALLEGRALLTQEKYPEALEKFEGLVSKGSGDAAIQRQILFANLGKAIALAGTGKADEGVKLAQDIIAKNDPQDRVLFGRAYNALGLCQLKANNPKEALLAFLHTDLLFDEEPEIHAEALYHLSRLWADANKADRAVRARGTLTSQYGGSVWAKRLQ